MSKEITIIEQKTVEFQGDRLTAVLAANGEVYVPIRPLCEELGLNWSGQRQRINRDPVLVEEMIAVDITYTEHEHGKAQTVMMLCLPLKFLNGFLFGINPSRVKKEIREKLIEYQRRCYDVLFQAFQTDMLTALGQRPESETIRQLSQIREMGLSIVRLAEEQIEHERRLTSVESRLDAAAMVVKNINSRLTSIESRMQAGQPVSDAQAAEVKEQVKALAMAMGGEGKHFQAIYSEIYRRWSVSSYKLIQARDYAEVIRFLQDWHQRLTDPKTPF